jgi:hypothetical protein
MNAHEEPAYFPEDCEPEYPYEHLINLPALHGKFAARNVNGRVSFTQARVIAEELGVTPNQGFDHLYEIYKSSELGISFNGLKWILVDLERIKNNVRKMESRFQEATLPSGRLSTGKAVEIMRDIFPAESFGRIDVVVSAKSHFCWTRVDPGEYVKLMRPYSRLDIQELN